jgi:integrase/recombinase XerC
MTQTDMFAVDTPEDWAADPAGSFEHWLATQEGRGTSATVRASTAKVYKKVWGNFVRYLQLYGVPLATVSAEHISQFLAQLEDQNRNQRERSRKLIERAIMAMHARSGLPGAGNPAAEALKERGAEWKQVHGNKPTLFLTRLERTRIVNYLLCSALTAQADWRGVRDRAMIGLFIGAGLKVAEAVRLMTVNCTIAENPGVEHRITISRPDSRFQRQIVLTGASRKLFTLWMDVRAAQLLATDHPDNGVVFPADIEARRDDKDAPAAADVTAKGLKTRETPRALRAMHPVTALRVTDAVVTDCGLTLAKDASRVGLEAGDVKNFVTRASPQTLRNSYAAGRFEEEQDAQSVANELGVLLVTAQRLHASWLEWRRTTTEDREGWFAEEVSRAADLLERRPLMTEDREGHEEVRRAA